MEAQLMYNHEIIILFILSVSFLSFKTGRSLLFPSRSPLPEQAAQGHLPFLDLAKGLSIIAVFAIHAASIIWASDIAKQNQAFLLTMNNLSRFAISVFLIASGALVKPLSEYGSYWKFLHKKFLGVFLPYILVAIALGLARSLSPEAIFSGLLTGKLSPPFYFVIVLFQLYLLYPLLSWLNRFRFFLPLAFALSFASFLLPDLWYIGNFIFFSKFLFFFSLGLRLRTALLCGALPRPDWKLLLLFVFLYLALFSIFPAFLFNIRLIYGPIIFYLLYIGFAKTEEPSLVHKKIEKIGQHSLWLFLIHYPLMESLFPLLQNLTKNIYLFYGLLFFITFFACLLLAYPAKKYYARFVSFITF